MQKIDLLNTLQDVPDDDDIKIVTSDGDVLNITDTGYEAGVGYVIRSSSPGSDEDD